MRKLLIAAAVSLALVGCSKIETENVGVRTTFTGNVNMNELEQGFYTHILSDITEFSGREMSIELENMTPKAADNLTLEDMDVEIYYRAAKNQIAEQYVKYQGRHARHEGVGYISYFLVRSLARESVYAEVARYDSLQVHQNRTKIAQAIKENVQGKLEQSDPGVFSITKVIIRNVKTDRSIEDSIKLAVQKNKELEAKKIELNIAKEQEKINNALTASLSKEILRQRELEAMVEACSSGNTCIIDFTGGTSSVVNMVGRK